METITTGRGTFLFVEVHRHGVVFYENMGYLIYREPAYENWVPDKILWDPIKLDKFLAKHEGKPEYKQTVVKLPEGNWKFSAVMASGVLDHHEASQNISEKTAEQIVDDNGMGCWDNYRLKRDEKYTCTTAMNSFESLILMSKHSLKVGVNYAILKLQV